MGKNKKYIFIGFAIGALVSFLVTSYLAIIDIRDLDSELKLSQERHGILKGHFEFTLWQHLDNNFKFVISYARETPDPETLAILWHEIKEHNSLSPFVRDRKDFAKSMMLMLVKTHELSEKYNQGDLDAIAKLASSACQEISPIPKSCEIIDLGEMLVAFEKEDYNYVREYFGVKDKEGKS